MKKIIVLFALLMFACSSAPQTTPAPQNGEEQTTSEARDGQPGATGATGPQGPQGVTGAIGQAGPEGPEGPSGATTTIAGPQGVAGLKGDKGDVGPQGPMGLQGSIGLQGPAGTSGSSGISKTGMYDVSVPRQLVQAGSLLTLHVFCLNTADILLSGTCTTENINGPNSANHPLLFLSGATNSVGTPSEWSCGAESMNNTQGYLTASASCLHAN